MLLTVAEFKQRSRKDIAGLIADLRVATGRGGPEEAKAWERSLPTFAKLLGQPYFDDMHLFFGGAGGVSLEYRIPGSSGWCDAVLLGQRDSKPVGVIVELKHWDTTGDQPGRWTGLISHRGLDMKHPSDQVKGYVEYCSHFHSAISSMDAELHGCAVFTTTGDLAPYRVAPNEHLAREYPLFSASPDEVAEAPEFLRRILHAPHEGFARAFELGRYIQPRSLCIQVAKCIADEKSSPFILIDEQRTAFAVAMAEVHEAMASGEKRIIVIEGPPGSGKSVVAARIWASLALESGGESQSIAMVSTSSSQHSNWKSLFQGASENIAAGGFILKANNFVPISIKKFQLLKDGGLPLAGAKEWRENLDILSRAGVKPTIANSTIGVSIVDEAHALVNPASGGIGAGMGMLGFAVGLGPQAYHIVRGSKVTIFLMDSKQGFRERESTRLEDIRQYAELCGVEKVTTVDLSGNQFRCGGSVEYTDWVEGLLDGESPATLRTLARDWTSDTDPRQLGTRDADRKHHGLEFVIAGSPIEMESILRDRMMGGAYSARILSSYSVPWPTKKEPNPHSIALGKKDFCIPVTPGPKGSRWLRVWNVVSGIDDYTPYIQGVPGGGSRIHDDSLSEVGCPYVVRGFDFDYVGLLWLNDLVWSPTDHRWILNLENVHESGLRQHRTLARRGDPEAMRLLLEKVKQAYRILMTRPIRGIVLYIQDEATRRYIKQAVGA